MKKYNVRISIDKKNQSLTQLYYYTDVVLASDCEKAIAEAVLYGYDLQHDIPIENEAIAYAKKVMEDGR